MSEFLHTASYEPITTNEWMKQHSLELMYDMHNPDYPAERLVWGPDAVRGAATGRLYLPKDGPFHAPTKHDETLTLDLLKDFQAKGYELDSCGRPVHPWADELLELGTYTGKGFYYEFGGNQTADPILFRYDQSEPLVLLVQRSDSLLWAVPGGFVDEGESIDEAAMREAREETMPGVPKGAAYELFDPEKIPVYQGPVADRRATLNAWPETTAFAIHLNPHLTHVLPLHGRGDPKELGPEGYRWVTIEEAAALPMFGSHRLLLELAKQTLPARMLANEVL